MKNLRLGVRLTLGFALLVLLLLISTAIGFNRLGSVNANTHLIAENLYLKSKAASNLSYLVMDTARVSRNLILLTDEAKMAPNKAAFEADVRGIEEQTAVLERLADSDRNRDMVAAVKSAGEAYMAFSKKVATLGGLNKTEEATSTLFGPEYATQGAYLKVLTALREAQEKQMQEASAAADATYRESVTTLSIFALVAVLASIACAFTLTRSITAPLQRAVEASDRVASGDLSHPISVDSTDEVGRLLASLQRMQASLIGTVTRVRGNAESVSTASSEIAQGNQDLSSRTESQASALQQTAASMEQLGSAVKHNAESSLQANQLAQGASTIAVQGGDVVSQVVETMKGINESSRKIADIIGVIDSIAFQTNILALNAAVEAARAGEQGRGFAVVASEVRNLAGRSAEAAKEIRSLIAASVERVSQGTQLVDKAGTTMTDVVSAIRRVTDLMGEISAASSEQSAGVAQVGEAVTQMDQVTQQNAALVEEMAAAASSLKNQAEDMVQAVAAFKLGDDRPAVRPAVREVPAAPVANAAKRVAATKPAAPRTLTAPAAKPVGAAAPAKPARQAETEAADWEAF